MNNETTIKKDRVTKTVAITGFLALIAFIAWASVQIVAFIPNTFTSLASLAEGINQYRESMSKDADSPLEVTSNTKLANVDQAITINWNKDGRAGTYTFSYPCTEGVAIDIVDTDGLRAISCDTRYSLGDTNSVSIKVNSEKNRHQDIAYTVSFMRSNDTGPIRSGGGVLTITNETISEFATSTTTPTTPPSGAVLGENTPAPTKKPVPKPTPVVVTPTPEYVYEIPVSNPNGFTDLGTRFLATGKISAGRFVATSIERNDSGAFQFEVKNTGTKTSQRWTYSVTLPDGETYTSPSQTPLKPNERAVIAIGFDTPNDSSHTFTVSVELEDDRTNTNNRFARTVRFN